MDKLYDKDFDELSFDILEFIDRLEVNADWAKLMVAHIYLDHILTLYINDRLPRPDVYLNSGHRGFSEKLSLCTAHGFLDEETSSLLKAVNACRNKFAHQLIFTIPDSVKKDLFRAFTQTRPAETALEENGFDNLLLTVVLVVEMRRQAFKKSSDIEKKIATIQDEMYEYIARLVEEKRDRDAN